jgi:anaphase-promoting complex subunit 8
MDPFLFYIYGVVLKGMNQKQEAIGAFVEAVNGYPLLWAAWQELIALSTNKEVVSICK